MVQHQLVVNACDMEQLTASIGRIRRMRLRLHDENMRDLIGSIEGLPVLPAVCRELNTVLARQDFAIRDLAQVVEKDPSLCAKLLQTVNSSFFSVGRKMSTVQDAIAYLGTTMLKNLVMSVSLWRSLEEARPEAISRLQRVHTRCQRVAVLSRKIMSSSRTRAEEAFVAGLLHDIGETLLIVYLPERWERATKQAQATGRPLHEVEQQLYNVDHAELGAHLLDAWGLPFPVLEAVAFHHTAPELEHNSLETADAVYIAETLVHARESGADPEAALDKAYLERLDVADQVRNFLRMLSEP
ncbi:MAG: hupR1 3 [Myxococcaceae bacterium]|nr:hupR1 3 [Myxococcaceae bacterium]